MCTEGTRHEGWPGVQGSADNSDSRRPIRSIGGAGGEPRTLIAANECDQPGVTDAAGVTHAVNADFGSSRCSAASINQTCPMKKIAIEFDGSAVDAKALARAVAYVLEARRVQYGSTHIEGFSMNPTDKWNPGDPQITIVQK